MTGHIEPRRAKPGHGELVDAVSVVVSSISQGVSPPMATSPRRSGWGPDRPAGWWACCPTTSRGGVAGDLLRDDGVPCAVSGSIWLLRANEFGDHTLSITWSRKACAGSVAGVPPAGQAALLGLRRCGRGGSVGGKQDDISVGVVNHGRERSNSLSR